MSAVPDRLELLRRSWTMVAEGYLQHFVPRFDPWTRKTLQLLADSAPPHAGTIAVPACGPGQELPLLAAAFPRHRIMGIDLAEGMAELARQLVARSGLGDRVEVRVGDASRLAELAPLAAVVSCFGLQQMPQPAQVLAHWTRALRPGGVLCVCFWPQAVEDSGPWQRLAQLTAPSRPQPDWEADLPGAALREGAELLQDSLVAHEMAWPSVDAFWQAMTCAGPWHSRLLAHGEEYMEGVRQEFMRGYPDAQAPLHHTARARLVCLRRLPATAASL